MHRTYLDWASTSIPDPHITRRMAELSTTVFANPSSRHLSGREASSILASSRQKCAELLHCRPDQLVFTSGGSESNNLVLFSLLFRKKLKGLVTSGIEHPSVYIPAVKLKKLGCPVRFVKAEKSGHVDPQRVADAVDETTGMVSVMTVNNETGAIQCIEKIISLIRDKEKEFGHPIHIHTDAVQALGKIPFSLQDFRVDSAAFSGHKIQGPRCTGLLYVDKDLSFLNGGGDQEFGKRPGTECLGGIFGFGLALEKALGFREEVSLHSRKLMGILQNEINSIPQSILNSRVEEETSSPFILNASFPPIPGEVLVRVMSDRGFDISTGSACSSSKDDRTRVLDNMNYSKERAFSAIRISIGPGTTENAIIQFAKALSEEVKHLKAGL